MYQNYKIHVWQHNSALDFPCVLCGDVYEQPMVAASLRDRRIAPGHTADETFIGDVCPTCLDAMPKGAAERTREYAGLLEKRAASLRWLADNVEDIPPDDWATSKDIDEAAKALTAMMNIEVDPDPFPF